MTTKPVDYSGVDTDTFPAPAPSGPYGKPAPQGSATLASTFDGTDPNGAWSLYAVTVGEGDGTGAITGGWSIDFAVASQTVSFTTTAPTTADAGTTYDANALASSTLAVAYSIDSSSTPGACSVKATSGVVSFLAAGTCTVDVNQSGDGNYNAAPQAQQTINVVSVPGEPTGLSAMSGNGEVVLHWTAPTSNGGSAITSYDVYEGTTSGNEALLENTGSAATSTPVIGLTNGTPYYFEVSALNGVGEGGRSAETSATPATVPGTPTGLTATTGNGEVMLNWTAPNDGGSPITSYNIYEGTSSGGETLLQGTGSSGTSTTIVGLTNGTTYYFEVSGVNVIGEGGLSTEASATPATTPGAPPGSPPHAVMAVLRSAGPPPLATAVRPSRRTTSTKGLRREVKRSSTTRAARAQPLR